MIHQPADVHDTVTVPESSVVWRFAQIMMGVVLGDNVSVGSGAYIGHYSRIGRGTRIGQGAHITDHMTVGENCFIAPHVIFCNDKNPVPVNPVYKREDPICEDDVSIGVNATILPGVRLGRGCRIGAGAVVTKDVPPYQVWVGNPARRLIRKPQAPPFPAADEASGLQGL